MGGHGEFHGPPKVPDHKIYKVDNCPQLSVVQRKLAQHGLKDPWLRNEVWRYPPGTEKTFEFLHYTLLRKWKWGLAAAVLTIAGEKIYHNYYPEEHGHH